MFKPSESSTLSQVSVNKDDLTGETIVTFPSCLDLNTLGESPQGRLEINRIKTPPSRRDTGFFYFEVYKDQLYQSKIAELDNGIQIFASEMEPGVIKDITVVPDVFLVQEITFYTITFTTGSSLFAGSDIEIKFPNSIFLPTNPPIVNVIA